MTQRITVTIEDSQELEVLHDGEITVIRRRVFPGLASPGLAAGGCIDTEGEEVAEVISLDDHRKGER